MPVTGDAWSFEAIVQLALKAAAVATALGGSAVLYGMWDRIAMARAKAREAERQGGRDEVDDGKQLRVELRGDLTTMRKWLAEEEEAHRETSRDRDRGWDLARYWNRRAHAARHAALNARQVAEGYARRLEAPPPDWSEHPSVVLPDELE